MSVFNQLIEFLIVVSIYFPKKELSLLPKNLTILMEGLVTLGAPALTFLPGPRTCGGQWH